jgi:hypothetical protein
MNYPAKPHTMTYRHGTGTDLIIGQAVQRGQPLKLKPWGLAIVEER